LNAIYDVFRKLPEGQVWIDSVEGMENARARVMRMIKAEPGEYYVYDLFHKKVVLRVSEEDTISR
jgi:hypothetical protein